MKKFIFLTILASLTCFFRLNAQTSDSHDALIISDNELSKYLWSCSNIIYSDKMLFDNDSIILTKGIGLENTYFYFDTTSYGYKKYQVIFDNKSNSFFVYYVDHLKSGKKRKNSKNDVSLNQQYQSDSLTWSIDRASQLLNISSNNNKSWIYTIKEIDKNSILLIHRKQ